MDYVNRLVLQKTLKKDIELTTVNEEFLFCKGEIHTDNHFTSKMVQVIEDNEIETLNENSSDLRIYHFFKLSYDFGGMGYTRQILVVTKVLIVKLKELDNDFPQFIRKNYYCFSNEPKRKEQTTWMGAILFIEQRATRLGQRCTIETKYSCVCDWCKKHMFTFIPPAKKSKLAITVHEIDTFHGRLVNDSLLELFKKNGVDGATTIRVSRALDLPGSTALGILGLSVKFSNIIETIDEHIKIAPLFSSVKGVVCSKGQVTVSAVSAL